MQRHTGGVQGTVLLRGYCPVCKRGLAGGNTERGQARGTRISLRPHKPPRWGSPGDPPARHVPDCPGSRSVVAVDRDLTAAWAERLRAAEEERRERWRS